MARIEWDKDWPAKMDSAIDRFMNTLADDVLTDMRVNCPVDTGELLADLDAEVVNKTARIGARSVPHAIYAEEGVGPHIITPNSKKALWWEGALHPVKVVNHPGMEGTHFMKNALYRERTP
jgi:hypothetical protein